MRLQARRLSYAYPQRPLCLRDVSFAVDCGWIGFLLGANGSGKTTLLGCMAGTRSPGKGEVLLDGVSLRALAPRERAKRIGVVPQFPDTTFAFRVEDAVGLGRAPYVGLLSQPGPEDRRAVAQAIEAVGLKALQGRSTAHLSGGERQLVWLARGLAQGADCLLLDEPTAHLDPAHEQAVFSVVQRLAARGATFLVASHHPETALLYGTHATFLREGAVIRSGSVGETITAAALREAYGMDFSVLVGSGGERSVVPRIDDGRPRNVAPDGPELDAESSVRGTRSPLA
ncbi:MAG: ABC transporter ATP-binding protein [Candidatus Bipolaricaulota bacterium]